MALKYARSTWQPDLVPMVLGEPHKKASAQMTVFNMILPERGSTSKSAIKNPNVLKSALALLERFIQARCPPCVSLLDSGEPCALAACASRPGALSCTVLLR